MLDARRLAFLVALLLVAQPALAAPPFGKKVRVALLDVKAQGAVQTAAVAGMNPLLAGAASKVEGIQLLTSADLRAMVGLEQKQDLLHCEQSSCMAETGRELGLDYVIAPAVDEVGGALGVDQVVTSELSKAGADYVVSLSVVDIHKGAVVARVAKQVEQVGNVPDAAALAVKEALFELGGAPAPSAAVREGTIVRTAGGGDARRGFGWALLGTGLAAAAVGTYFELGALTTIDRDRAAVQAQNEDERPGTEELAGALRAEGAARGCFVGGLLLVGFGSYYLLTGDEPAGVQR